MGVGTSWGSQPPLRGKLVAGQVEEEEEEKEEEVEWRPQQTRPGRQPQSSTDVQRRDFYTFCPLQLFLFYTLTSYFHLRSSTFCAEGKLV